MFFLQDYNMYATYLLYDCFVLPVLMDFLVRTPYYVQLTSECDDEWTIFCVQGHYYAMYYYYDVMYGCLVRMLDFSFIFEYSLWITYHTRVWYLETGRFEEKSRFIEFNVC